MRRMHSILLAAFTFCFFTSAASATPLDLVLPPSPDIVSQFITVDYAAATGTLSADGYALELADGVGGPEAIRGGTFGLHAILDDLGNLQAGGTLSIGGTIPTIGANSGTLLTGTLTSFGFRPVGGDPLEFLFEVTGGDLAGLYGELGAVILSGTGFAGSFASDFGSGIMQSVSDTAPVPEPSAALVFMLGALVVGKASRSS